MTIDDVLSKQRGQVAGASQELLQEILDGYDAGITSTSIAAAGRAARPSPCAPPSTTWSARGRTRDRLVNEAEGYRNEMLPGARAQAVELIESANGYREARVAEATGEAQRFTALEQEYRKAPEVTRPAALPRDDGGRAAERREGDHRARGGGRVALSAARSRRGRAASDEALRADPARRAARSAWGSSSPGTTASVRS